MNNNKKTTYTCLGCGCGAVLFAVIFAVVAYLLFGDSISNAYNKFANPKAMTYEGQKIPALAEAQRLPYNPAGTVPRVDGTYKNKKHEVGLRFKGKFQKNSTETVSVELFLIDNPKKKLKFKAKSCGCSLYDITDDKGKRWGFASIGNEAKSLYINDNGLITAYKFDKDPTNEKKKKKK